MAPKTITHSITQINVKLHKNCENTGKIQQISCVGYHFDGLHLKLLAVTFLDTIKLEFKSEFYFFF